ncbi:MAG: MFS transporter, partial [Deltaproteobacteria bacterium]|nr:MFS transporter [Deltaproteobacteria bacterium]
LYSFGVFFSPILTEFGWTRAQTSAAYSFCIILSAFLSILVGRLTDRFGPRLVMTACGLSLGLGYVLTSWITAIWHLYIFYGLLIGFGMSGAYVPLLATVSRWFIKRRGIMTGISSAGGGVGAIIIPPIVGWLIYNYQWRTSYMIMGIVALLLIIMSAQLLKRDPAQIGLAPYGGNTEKNDTGNPEADSYSLTESMHTWQLWVLCAIFACNLLPLSAMVVHIVVHAIGLGILESSGVKIIAFIGAGGIIGRIILAGAADRIGNKTAIIIGFSLMMFSMLWVTISRELWMLFIFGFVFGFSSQGLISVMPLVISELFGLGSLGALLGIVNAGGAIGEATGPILTGWIFDITTSYHWAFICCAVLSFIGIILTILLRSTNGLRLKKEES